MTREPPVRAFRPERHEYDPAKAEAEVAGVGIVTLLRAMLREFNANPGKRLAALKPHIEAVRAETRSRGRPPTQPTA